MRGEPPTLRRALAPLLRWWWLPLAGAAVAALSSWIATADLEPRYRVRTTLLVGRALDAPNPSNNDIWLTRQLAQTYADLARRRPVQEAVLAALELDRLPPYRVGIVADTQLVEIEVTDHDAERARRVAQEIAARLIALAPQAESERDRERQTFLQRTLDALETSIASTERSIASMREELAAALGAQRIGELERAVGELQRSLNDMQANYAALLAQTPRGSLNSLQVVEPATLPTEPIGPGRLPIVLATAAVGLLLGVAAGYVLDHLDDTVTTPEDVAAVTGLTTLASVPALADTAIVASSSAEEPALEAFRVLRTNLRFAAVDGELRTLLITSAAPGEGKSLTTASLARTMAQAGRKTLVVDADLRRPRQHRIFGLVNSLGLTSALLEPERPLDSLLQETEVAGLHVLTAGPLPPNPAELLDSGRMRELMERLHREAYLVLVDSPPVLATADATILASLSQGTLLVIGSARTGRDEVARAAEALRKVGARVLGAVLNRVAIRGSDYRYYYSYRDEATPPARWWRRWRRARVAAPVVARRAPVERTASGGESG